MIVFHRLKMAQIAPPSVIFPPGDAPDTPLQLEQYKGTTGGWRLSHAPLLESALDAMLTPFVKPMDGNAAPGPGDDAASEPDVEVGPVEKKLREDKENEGGMPLANGIAPVGSGNGIGEDDDMPALVPAAPAGLGADDAMHSGEAADTDQDMPSIDLNDLVQPDTPVHSVDGTPSTSAEGAPTEEDVGMEGESAKELARGGLGAEPSATDLADMASAPDGDGADAMAVDGATQPSGTSAVQDAAPAKRYTLALGMPGGQVKFSYGTTPPEVGGLRGDAPLYLCADWQAAALEGLDRAAWESPREHESAVTARSPATLRPREVTLHDCVEAFCQREQLDASDSWYCSKCKDHVQAEKKLDLWRLPEVLVVHLKRFSYSRYSRDKLDTEVAFPLEELDLRAFVPATEGGTLPVEGTGVTGGAVPPAPVYDLFAVSNHFGGLGGGHYTAFCRMPDDGRWYTFDDSSVHEMDPGSVRSSAAYVLFYRRRGAADPDVAKVIAEAANASAIDVFGDSGRRGSGLVLEQVGEALEEEESGAVDVKVEMDEGEGAGDGERGTSLTAHKLPLDTEDADADDDDDMILGKIA